MMVSSEDNTPTGLVRHRVSLRAVASEILLSAGAAILLLASVVAGIVFLGPTAGLVYATAMIIGFYVVELILPHIAATKRMKLLELQTKMAHGESTDLYADTQKLVEGYMGLKEFATAEHYSALLLKQSALAAEQRDQKLNQVVASSDCWVSTEEYQRGWMYKLVWAFETRGRLSLDRNSLTFDSKSLTFHIDLADIRAVEIRHHGWCLHMARFKYLLLKFVEDGKERELYLSPTASDRINVWYVNKGAEQWCELIRTAKHKRGITRVVDSMRAQISDVESSTGQTKV